MRGIKVDFAEASMSELHRQDKCVARTQGGTYCRNSKKVGEYCLLHDPRAIQQRRAAAARRNMPGLLLALSQVRAALGHQ